MSNEKTVQIFDALTGETISRELTEPEILELDEANKVDEKIKKARKELRQSALAKLTQLGLTEEEIAAL
jgi:predicted Holliday junction resolvase-like endonuclease